MTVSSRVAVVPVTSIVSPTSTPIVSAVDGASATSSGARGIEPRVSTGASGAPTGSNENTAVATPSDSATADRLSLAATTSGSSAMIGSTSSAGTSSIPLSPKKP